MKKSFNIQKTLLHRKSKHHETKSIMHPSYSSSTRAFQRDPSMQSEASSRAFQRDQQACGLKHPSSMDLISTNKTKQNKQTNYLPSQIEITQIHICFIVAKNQSWMQAIPGPDWYESLKIVSTQYQYQPGMKIIINHNNNNSNYNNSDTRTSRLPLKKKNPFHFFIFL